MDPERGGAVLPERPTSAARRDRAYHEHRLLGAGGTLSIASFRTDRLALFELAGARETRHCEAPAEIRDATLHAGSLWLAMRGRDPEAAALA